jgi:hypothetical protein
MKKDEYAPGLSVYTADVFIKGVDRGLVGETISPEPRRKDGDRSHNLYVQVKWRDGRTSIVLLSRLARLEAG